MGDFEGNEQVVIAKDVLRHLDARLIVAEPGIWIDFGLDTDHPGTVDDLKKRAFDSYCKVCADGALFVAYMLREYDRGEVSQNIKLGWRCAAEIEKALKGLFSRDQLILIDVAFEKGCGYFNYKHFSSEDRGKNLDTAFQGQLDLARDFCEAIDEEVVGNDDLKATGVVTNLGAEKRLRKIMNNIIENNGVFTP